MKKDLPAIGFILIVLFFLIVVPSLQGCANYDWSFNKHYTQQ